MCAAPDRAAKPPLSRNRNLTSLRDAEHTRLVNSARWSVTWVPAICARWNYDKAVVLHLVVAPSWLPGESDPLFRPAHRGATFLSGSQVFPYRRQANLRPQLPIFGAGKIRSRAFPRTGGLATVASDRCYFTAMCDDGHRATRPLSGIRTQWSMWVLVLTSSMRRRNWRVLSKRSGKRNNFQPEMSCSRPAMKTSAYIWCVRAKYVFGSRVCLDWIEYFRRGRCWVCRQPSPEAHTALRPSRLPTL